MKKGKKITATFTLVLLVAMFLAPFVPTVVATPMPKIDFCEPNSGFVGTNVMINGTIDTPNGTYEIRWDGNLIKTGKCELGTNVVNDTFIVPESVFGSHDVTLYDVNSTETSSAVTFTIETKYYVRAIVPSPPQQLQEGQTTVIWVNITGGETNTCYWANITVTDPSGTVYFNDTLQLTNTTNTGYGEGNVTYPTDFGSSAHTNYTGTYKIALNETLENGNFTVGLTDKIEYYATETVQIRGAGYQANENITINLITGGTNVPGYPKPINAGTDGVANDTWEIPIGAEPGNYTISLTNATTPGTIKAVPDIQNFTVFVVKIDSIDPDSGPVGTEVRVLGEIIMPEGEYAILWDNESVKEGTCAPDSRTVNDTFIVPPSVLGNHTVTLHDNVHEVNSTSRSFEVNKTAYYVFAEPDWVQEGLYTNITISLYGGEANKNYTFLINVTDPTGVSSTANLTVQSNETGSGTGFRRYWDEFAGGNITKFVGVYSITVNETDLNLTGEFTVGLTDKPKYRRDEIVSIRGSAYQPNENVTIDIEFGGMSITGYPEINITADTEGVVTDYWLIPVTTEPGTYTVAITNATTPGTVKDPADVQNFTVTGVICQIQARNLDNETVAGVTVYVWNATEPITIEELPIASGDTNETGWVRFPLEADNYTFWALWREEVMVGSFTNRSITEDCVLTLPCQLAHIKIAIKDEAAPPNPLPFINVTLVYNYTTWYGTPHEEAPSSETDFNGTVVISNTITNISYTIEARRYDHLFNSTLIENLTTSIWVNITCPTYTLFVNVLDANELPVRNVQVAVYEWSTWIRVQSPKVTNQSGSVDFFITFGRYKVRVSNYSAELKSEVVINETVIDLVEENQWMPVHCKLLNLDLSMKIIDYFGQPIPNALVKIKRENVEMEDLITGSNGIAPLDNVIGGDYQVSVYIRGKLCGNMSLWLDSSREIVFKIGRYLVIGGYPMEISQFITLVSLSLLVGAFGLALLYRKLPSMMKRKKKPSKKGG